MRLIRIPHLTDISIKNADGKTAADIANESNSEHITALLNE